MIKKNKKKTVKKPTKKVVKKVTNNYVEPKKHILAPYPHFRYYKKSGHPALIVGEQPIEEYRYRKVMHGAKDGGSNNEEVYPNPNPKDTAPMYIGKRERHDKKKYFEGIPLPWKYPKK